MTVPVPELCRLEYLTPKGWQVGHHGINLLHPERYVERLAAKGKVGRVTVLSTGQVFGPDAVACTICGEDHPDGSCLI